MIIWSNFKRNNIKLLKILFQRKKSQKNIRNTVVLVQEKKGSLNKFVYDKFQTLFPRLISY